MYYALLLHHINPPHSCLHFMHSMSAVSIFLLLLLTYPTCSSSSSFISLFLFLLITFFFLLSYSPWFLFIPLSYLLSFSWFSSFELPHVFLFLFMNLLISFHSDNSFLAFFPLPRSSSFLILLFTPLSFLTHLLLIQFLYLFLFPSSSHPSSSPFVPPCIVSWVLTNTVLLYFTSHLITSLHTLRQPTTTPYTQSPASTLKCFHW